MQPRKRYLQNVTAPAFRQSKQQQSLHSISHYLASVASMHATEICLTAEVVKWSITVMLYCRQKLEQAAMYGSVNNESSSATPQLNLKPATPQTLPAAPPQNPSSDTAQANNHSIAQCPHLAKPSTANMRETERGQSALKSQSVQQQQQQQQGLGN